MTVMALARRSGGCGHVVHGSIVDLPKSNDSERPALDSLARESRIVLGSGQQKGPCSWQRPGLSLKNTQDRRFYRPHGL